MYSVFTFTSCTISNDISANLTANWDYNCLDSPDYDKDDDNGYEFRICVWGDTQSYVSEDYGTKYNPSLDLWNSDKKEAYQSQIQYALELNCDAILHMGDITETASKRNQTMLDFEWGRTLQMLNPLRDSYCGPRKVFSPSQGNHDEVSRYISFIINWGSPEETYFKTISSTGLSHSIVANIGGQNQLIISIGCGWAKKEFQFLKDQTKAYPEMPTIVHSHISVHESNMYFKSTNNCPYHNSKNNPDFSEIENYIRSQKQIYLLAGGHYAGSSANLDSERGENDSNPLLLIWTNFQNWVYGGDGWFMVVTIDTSTGLAHVGHYNNKRKVWLVKDSGPSAEGIFDIKWGNRGSGFQTKTTGKTFDRPNSIPTTGYYASDNCNSLYFANDGHSGRNNCMPDAAETVLKGAPYSFASGNPSDLPTGSALGSTAFLTLSDFNDNLRTTSSGSTDWLDYDSGFVCFWGKINNTPLDQFYWLRNQHGETRFSVSSLFDNDSYADGASVFNFGNTEIIAEQYASLVKEPGSYQHLCLGWNKNPENGNVNLLATINGQNACPDSECSIETGVFLFDELLSVGPSGPGAEKLNFFMHELLFVEDTTLTPSKARWIVACGAGDDANSSQRIDAYLEGKLDHIEGPNGETECSH